MLILEYAVVAFFAIGLTVVAISIVEWWLHRYLLHEWEGTAGFESHGQHHVEFKGKDYSRPEHQHVDESFGLPPSLFIKVTLGALLTGILMGYLTGYWIVIPVCTTGTTFFYLVCLGLLHKWVHQPKGRWFEKTSLFKYLSRCHQVHHANPGTNFCILLPFVADRMLRTYQ
mgnify:CR=1 FL=1